MGRSLIVLSFGCAILAGTVGFLGGCDEEKADGKISLDAVIPDPVTVDVGLLTGTMTFDFSADPLDSADTTELIQLLASDVISLSLSDGGNGVTYELSEGTFINAEPDYPGEYQVLLSEEGALVEVVFYNSFDGAHVQAGGDYTATLDVVANDYFATESFTRAVTVE